MVNISDYRSGLLNPDLLPTLDLHGEIGDISRVKINDFINENKKLKNRFICVIHGRSGGVIKNITQETLKRNKHIKEFGMMYRNDGMTIVEIII